MVDDFKDLRGALRSVFPSNTKFFVAFAKLFATLGLACEMFGTSHGACGDRTRIGVRVDFSRSSEETLIQL